MKSVNQRILQSGGLNMEQKIAVLSKEQEQNLKKIESELGCVLIAYEKKDQSSNANFH